MCRAATFIIHPIVGAFIYLSISLTRRRGGQTAPHPSPAAEPTRSMPPNPLGVISFKRSHSVMSVMK